MCGSPISNTTNGSWGTEGCRLDWRNRDCCPAGRPRRSVRHGRRMSPASGFEQFHHINPAAQVRHSQGDSLEKVRCLSAHRCSTAYHASEHSHSGDCCVLDEPCCRRGDFCAAGRHRGALAAFAICRRQLKVSNSISEESEEKPFMRKALVVALSLAMFCTACSTAWVSTLDSILAASAPALINILQIVAVAKGQPINRHLSAKIIADETVN